MPTTSRNRTVLPVCLVLTTAMVGAATTAAQDRPPPIDPRLRARFGFLDPVIKKLGHGTNMLQSVQWHKDGRIHVLVNNPHRAKIENMKLEKGKLESVSISTDGDLHGMTTADVDGDGKRDILMINSRGRLVIKLSDPKARALPDIEVGHRLIYDCLRCADLDGDGKPDALTLTRDGIRVIRRLGKKPIVSPTEAVFSTSVRSMHLLDVNGDTLTDVVLCVSGQRMQAHIKLGDGRGGFGAWILLDTPRLLTLFPGTGVGGASLAAIHAQPRRVVEYKLKTTKNAHRPALLLTALPTTTSSRAVARGDIDNDGDLDLVMSDGKRAQLTMLLEHDGQFQVRIAPTLAGIQCLSIGDADGDGKTDLVMASKEEESLSWVSGAGSLDAFPKTLATLPEIDKKPAIPIAAVVGMGETLVLLRSKNQETGLYRVNGAGKEATVTLLCDLGRQRREPRRMILTDLDGRFGPDVAYVLPSEGLQILFSRADGKFDKPSAASSAGFTKRMEDGALSLTRSGAESALLVVRERYTRRFRFDASGRPVILSQDNGPEGNPSMAMGTVLDDGTRLFLDRKANRLFRMGPGQPTVSTTVPAVTPEYMFAHGADVLIVGRLGVLRVPFGRSYELEPVRIHEPPTRKTRYYSGIAADLDGDGTPELAVADSHIHGVHVLVPQGAKLVRGLSFPIFESTDADREEPRMLATGDVNSDGLQDLLLLAHDRILIYYQER